ncbi:MAG: hypothetical protein COB01_01810 [Lutibacter sp.]|nr:MAG: hypothetical protein COB01_01810 [Lutibacter sp.]
MKFKINNNYYFLLVLVFTLLSCESEYSKLVKKELATEIKNDSLFFGMKFNDTKQEFFDICQELNEKELVSHGPENKFVEYIIKAPNDDGSSIQMLFYGIFSKKNIMTGLNMRFSYNAWSPWNKKLSADKLIPNIKDTLQKWFPGNEFIKVDLKDLNNEVYVKIDGNRQIKMYTIDEKVVAVKIEDLDKKSEYNGSSE